MRNHHRSRRWPKGSVRRLRSKTGSQSVRAHVIRHLCFSSILVGSHPLILQEIHSFSTSGFGIVDNCTDLPLHTDRFPSARWLFMDIVCASSSQLGIVHSCPLVSFHVVRTQTLVGQGQRGTSVHSFGTRGGLTKADVTRIKTGRYVSAKKSASEDGQMHGGLDGIGFA